VSRFDDVLATTVELPIKRIGSPGAFLDVSAYDTRPDATVLLLGPEIPEGAKVGDVVRVFLYLDSEARPLATTRRPLVERGLVAFVEVTQTTHFGAFVDWGLAKELLVPFAEQTAEMRKGRRYPVSVSLDPTGRLIGTMKVTEVLRASSLQLAAGDYVEGEAWREEPRLGVFVILDRRGVGLLPASEPHDLVRGDRARFRVSRVLADGKIELSLRARPEEQVEQDAAAILAHLDRNGAPPIGDHAHPEDLRRWVGMSKKAFKRAAGHLLKQRVVELDDAGHLRRR
jgi:predicted RNA-binding protein (virulence factor B family)